MKMFSHIYVESAAKSYPLTERILAKLAGINTTTIKHYKDIFNRRGQDFSAQKNAPALILAVNNGTRIYPGARFCQSFGNEHFYYTSQIKNCLYDCEYCFLQGMYPSGHIVIFVNVEDYFSDIDALLSEHPVYISISYDTDLLALEGLTGLVKEWCEYAKGKDKLLLELRTKCAATSFLAANYYENLVISYTISPSEIAAQCEHGASSTENRINAMYEALNRGFKTRLCIDPILPIGDYKESYNTLIDSIFANDIAANISEISIGCFRISKDYIKVLRGVRQTPITMYPYSNINGMFTFSEEKNEEILSTITDKLLEYVPANKIFRWDTLEGEL